MRWPTFLRRSPAPAYCSCGAILSCPGKRLHRSWHLGRRDGHGFVSAALYAARYAATAWVMR